jgi:hypothetical protein
MWHYTDIEVANALSLLSLYFLGNGDKYVRLTDLDHCVRY